MISLCGWWIPRACHFYSQWESMIEQSVSLCQRNCGRRTSCWKRENTCSHLDGRQQHFGVSSRGNEIFLIPIEIEACASPFQHRIRTGLQAEHQQLNHERKKIIEGSTHSRSNLIWYINWRIIPFYFLFSTRTYLDSDLVIIIKYFLIVFYI